MYILKNWPKHYDWTNKRDKNQRLFDPVNIDLEPQIKTKTNKDTGLPSRKETFKNLSVDGFEKKTMYIRSFVYVEHNS